MPIIHQGKILETADQSQAAPVEIDEDKLIRDLRKSTNKLEELIIALGGEIIEPDTLRDVEIKFNPSVARAVRRKGVITRLHPFKLTINNKEIELNDNIVDIINSLILEI